MPMPALNIMAIQARLLNSGFESSFPSRIRPKRLTAITTQSTRKTSAETTNSQSKLPSTQSSAVFDAEPKLSLPRAAQPTPAITVAMPMPMRRRSGPVGVVSLSVAIALNYYG
ncbi:hypothetical protein NONI108955_43060 [Nocardia ninae]